MGRWGGVGVGGGRGKGEVRGEAGRWEGVDKEAEGREVWGGAWGETGTPTDNILLSEEGYHQWCLYRCFF